MRQCRRTSQQALGLRVVLAKLAALWMLMHFLGILCLDFLRLKVCASWHLRQRAWVVEGISNKRLASEHGVFFVLKLLRL